jgi:hypothetical protein
VFSNDREMMRRATHAADVIMEHAVALGGVVSGEHGIGITKLKHLDPAAVEELAAHRARVDPRGVMNPKKLADRSVIDQVFTPSFNLLELEPRSSSTTSSRSSPIGSASASAAANASRTAACTTPARACSITRATRTWGSAR